METFLSRSGRVHPSCSGRARAAIVSAVATLTLPVSVSRASSVPLAPASMQFIVDANGSDYKCKFFSPRPRWSAFFCSISPYGIKL